MIKDIKILLSYRNLLLVFIWKNFSIRYRQSLLGVSWAIFQPLSLMLLFCLIFIYITPSPNIGSKPPLFFLVGLICWNFFASSIAYNIPILTSHYSLITKIYFPREILPLSILALTFIDFLIAWGMFAILAFFYHQHLSVAALWSIPLTLLLILFTFSLSLVLSCLNVFYRDLQLASNFFIQLLFFASPVFYSTKQATPKFKYFLHLNPMTFIIEQFRQCLLYEKTIEFSSFLKMLAISLLLFIFSYCFFKNMERKFADVI